MQTEGGKKKKIFRRGPKLAGSLRERIVLKSLLPDSLKMECLVPWHPSSMSHVKGIFSIKSAMKCRPFGFGHVKLRQGWTARRRCFYWETGKQKCRSFKFCRFFFVGLCVEEEEEKAAAERGEGQGFAIDSCRTSYILWKVDCLRYEGVWSF